MVYASQMSSISLTLMQQDTRKSRRDEYSEATKAALLAAARKLFTAEGYQATGIEAVARESRVTRGALYHHFEDKRALFDAVVVELQGGAAALVAARAGAARDPWTALRLGTEAFIDACLDPAYLRLVIQEGPAVLGIARCREIDMAHSRGMLEAALANLRRSGELDFESPDLLSSMFAAMECQAALVIADSGDRRRFKAQALDALDRMLNAFRKR